VAAQLDEYFAGTRRRFTLDLDLHGVDGFARRALEAMDEIPYGETASYGEWRFSPAHRARTARRDRRVPARPSRS
jgi:O6-methylguanine-DNA--protein-cysteine methyltransferase